MPKLPNPPPGGNYDTISDHPVLAGHDDPSSVVLLSAPGHTFSKTIHLDGTVEGNGHARWFNYEHATLAGIDALGDLLRTLSAQRDCFPIRGAVRSNLKPHGAQIRRKSARGDQHQYIVDAPRYWVMVDIDGSDFFVPPDWLGDPEASIRAIVRAELPEGFHNAAVIAQWSSSMRASGGIAKVHLWFWLSRPVWSIELKHWLSNQDTSVFHPVQEHFTAAPVYMGPPRVRGFFKESGCEDPSLDELGASRVLRLDGTVVRVPDTVPEPPDPYANSGYDNGNGTNLQRYIDAIGDHAGGLGLHRPIRDAALSYASTNGPDADWGCFRTLIRETVESALLDPQKRKASEIENRLGSGLEHNIKTAIEKVRRNPNRSMRRLTDEEIEEFRKSSRKLIAPGEAAPPFDTSFFDG